MTYQKIAALFNGSYFKNTYPTKDAFLAAVMKDRGEIGASAKEIHDIIVANIPEENCTFGEFREFGKREQERRRELSLRARRVLFDRMATKYLTNPPATNMRFPEDLLMESHRFPEAGQEETDDIREFNRRADEKNEHIRDVMLHMGDNRSEALDLVSEMFRKWEAADPLSLADHEWTDEEIVDNYERIHTVYAACQQVQNVFQYMRTAGIDKVSLQNHLMAMESRQNPSAEDTAEIESLKADIAKITEMERISAQYSKYGYAADSLFERMGLIESPYYDVLDVNDPNVHLAFQQVQQDGEDVLENLEIPGDTFTDPELTEHVNALSLEKRSSHFAANIATLRNNRTMGENGIANEMLEKMGVAPENRVYTCGDDDEPKPLGRFVQDEASNAFTQNVTFFDKTNPETKITTAMLSKTPLSLQAAAAEKAATFCPLPKKPVAVAKPVDPAPSAWKSFWHGLSDALYRDEFEAYNNGLKQQYEADKAAFEAYLRAANRYPQDLARATAYREKYVAAHPEDAAAAAALEEQKNARVEIKLAIAPPAAEAKVRIAKDVVADSKHFVAFGAEFAEPKAALAGAMNPEISSTRVEELFASLNEHCKLQLGTPDQERLFYLDENNRLQSYADVDLFDPKNQVQLVQMFRSDRLFAIPAGETTPVQVQVAARNSSHGVVYADNLGCPPKEPGFFTRLFSPNGPEMRAYRAALKQSHAARHIRAEIDRVTAERIAKGFDRRALSDVTPTLGTPSAEEIHRCEINAAAEAQNHTLKNHFLAVEKEIKRQNRIRDLSGDDVKEAAAFRALADIYGAKPVYHRFMEQKGCYTKENFATLQSYNVELQPADTVPETDEKGFLKLTEDQFTALASGAVFLPEIAKNHYVSEFPEHAKLLCTEACFDQYGTMPLNDVVLHWEPGKGWASRESISNFFDTFISPARQAAADAAKAYQAGERGPMARILAYNMMNFERQGMKEPFNSPARRMIDKVFGIQADMMKQDPALKSAVAAEIQKFKQKAQEDLRTYTAARSMVQKACPDFEKCCEIHEKGRYGNKKEQAAYREMLKTHPTYPDSLLKDSTLAVNIQYAKRAQLYNLDRSIEQIGIRNQIAKIYADAQAMRSKVELSVLEGKPMSVEEKQTYLKAVLAEELLFRHDKQVKERFDTDRDERAFMQEPSLRAAFMLPEVKDFPTQQKALGNVNTAKTHAGEALGNTFPPLYTELAKTGDIAKTIRDFVDTELSPEQQKAICAQSDAEFFKSLQKPGTIINNAEMDSVAAVPFKAYVEEAAREEEQFVMFELDDDPQPDTSPTINAPTM